MNINWNDVEPTNIGIIFVVIVSLIMILVMHLVGSRKYVFYRDGLKCHLTVTRYFLGLIPTTRKKYHNLVESKLHDYHVTDDFGNTSTRSKRAQVIVINRELKEHTLTKIISHYNVNEAREIVDNIQYFLKKTRQDTLSIHNGRLGAFIGSLISAFFIGVMFSVFVLFSVVSPLALITTKESFNSSSSLAQNKTAQPFISDLSKLPKDIPIPNDAKIEQVIHHDDTQKWQLMYELSKTGKSREKTLRDAFRQKGWQTSNIEELPRYSADGSALPGKAYNFGFRKSAGSGTGDVTVIQNADGTWLVTMRYPE